MPATLTLSNSVCPSTSILPLTSTVTKVDIPVILIFLPVTSSYTISPVTFKLPATVKSLPTSKFPLASLTLPTVNALYATNSRTSPLVV